MFSTEGQDGDPEDSNGDRADGPLDRRAGARRVCSRADGRPHTCGTSLRRMQQPLAAPHRGRQPADDRQCERGAREGQHPRRQTCRGGFRHHHHQWRPRMAASSWRPGLSDPRRQKIRGRQAPRHLPPRARRPRVRGHRDARERHHHFPGLLLLGLYRGRDARHQASKGELLQRVQPCRFLLREAE